MKTHARLLGVGASALIAFAIVAHFADMAPIAPLTLGVLGGALLLGILSLLLAGSRAAAVPAATAPDAVDAATVKGKAVLADKAAEKAPEKKPATIPPENDADRTGLRIGRYTLEERLAVGGMGEVWRATHETLIRPAALKIVRHTSGDTARQAVWLERFRREAVVTGHLNSPHTVELYDFGVDGKTLYLAMELLEGIDIATMVSRHGPLEDSRVAFLLRQACHSLIEAHEAGIVHRDIKPENLIITRNGRDYDWLKVIDFGLVKELSKGPGKPRTLTGAAGAQNLTAIGARPGTPGYMAPEQIEGSAIDQRADIYALACVAYFALTGLPVFEGTQEAQLMFAHVEVDPERPSVRAKRQIHKLLEDVIMRCLSKNPLKRPATMVALDDALAEIEFPSPWSQAKARQWWSEHEPSRMQDAARAS